MTHAEALPTGGAHVRQTSKNRIANHAAAHARLAATAIRSRRERSALNVIFFLFFHVLAWLGPGVHFHAYVSLNCLKS